MPILHFSVVSKNAECNWVDTRSGETSIKLAFTEGLGNAIYHFWTAGIDGVSVSVFFKGLGGISFFVL